MSPDCRHVLVSQPPANMGVGQFWAIFKWLECTKLDVEAGRVEFEVKDFTTETLGEAAG